MKKVICIIIVLIIIALGAGFIIHKNVQNKENTESQNMQTQEKVESIETKAVEIDGKQAGYTLLKNENNQIYGIEFENPDLMTKIEVVKRGYKEDVKNSLENNVYKFKETGIFKLKIETVNNDQIITPNFRVVTVEK